METATTASTPRHRGWSSGGGRRPARAPLGPTRRRGGGALRREVQLAQQRRSAHRSTPACPAYVSPEAPVPDGRTVLTSRAARPDGRPVAGRRPAPTHFHT